MTLACEGSATQALDPTSCGSFDFARRLASLRMTLHSMRARNFRNPLLSLQSGGDRLRLSGRGQRRDVVDDAAQKTVSGVVVERAAVERQRQQAAPAETDSAVGRG